jgi:tetratricopeptide (TPR) repeat protein
MRDVSDTVEHAQERAAALLEIGRPADAERELRAAIADDPDDPETYALMSRALIALDRPGEALTAARTAVALDPEDPDGHFLAALAATGAGDHALAERSIGAAMSLAPTWPAYVTTYAWLLADQGRHDEAIEQASRAQELDPESAEAAAILAASLAQVGRHDEAREASRTALALDPGGDVMHSLAGFAALARGDRSEAEARFREALRLDPSDDAARILLVESLKARNPVYRALLRFSLWQERLPKEARLGIALSPIILGFALRAVGLRDHPVGYALLGVAGVLLLVTWSAEPVMNLVILTTREGRRLLDSDRRRTAYLFLGFVVAGVLSIGLVALGASGVFAGLAFGWFIFALGIGSAHDLSPGRRRLIDVLAWGVAACSLVAAVLGVAGLEDAAFVPVFVVVLAGIASLWVHFEG